MGGVTCRPCYSGASCRHRLLDRRVDPNLALESLREIIVIDEVQQYIASFEKTQETMALLRILALGNRQIEAGQVETAADVIARLRERKRHR